MTTAVQRRRGTNTEHASFTGLDGEITVNTTTYTIHVHDGTTVGGIVLAKADGSNISTSSIDINGGTIDGTVIGGSSAAAGSFTTLTASGEITANGGIALGDNDRATFGASDDLIIEHTGSFSRIQESGTGDLYIQGTNIQFTDGAGAESYASFVLNGAVNLYYDGSAKLATTASGIDVTGTVTADGLSVNGDLDFTGTSRTISAVSNLSIDIDSDSNSAGAALTITGNGGSNAIFKAVETGDISFYDDTGVSQSFYWDASAESLGIGTTNPSHPLTVQASGTSGNSIKILGDSTNDSGRILWRNNADSSSTAEIEVNSSQNMIFKAGAGVPERMRIDSSGKVGIGTTSPSEKLHLSIDSAPQAILLERTGSFPSKAYITNGGNLLTFSYNANGISFNTGSTPTETMRINSSGNVGIGTTNPATALDVNGTVTADGLSVNGSDVDAVTIFSNGQFQLAESTTTSRAHTFLSRDITYSMVGGNIRLDQRVTTGTHIGYSNGTNARGGSGVVFENTSLGSSAYGEITFVQSNDTNDDTWVVREAMRIDSSGNLLVGKSASNSNNVGCELLPSGIGAFTASGANPLLVNRNTSDGELVLFRKDGTTVGSIGSNNDVGSKLYIGSSASAIKFKTNAIVPATENGANNNNDIDLGENGNAFKNLYLSGGVYLGGTGSANKLDDYEEGTWTPVLTDGTNNATLSVDSGAYVKMGQMVYIMGRIDVSSLGSCSGTVKISGLPFTVISSTVTQGGGMVNWGTNLNLPIAGFPSLEFQGNSTDFVLRDMSTSGSSGIQFSELTTNTQLRFQGFYRV